MTLCHASEQMPLQAESCSAWAYSFGREFNRGSREAEMAKRKYGEEHRS